MRGGPRVTFEFLLRWSTWSEPAGRFEHIVKCARILRPVNWAPQPQPHLIRCPRGRPMRLNVGTRGKPRGSCRMSSSCAATWLSAPASRFESTDGWNEAHGRASNYAFDNGVIETNPFVGNSALTVNRAKFPPEPLCSEPAGRLGHIVKCARMMTCARIWRPASSAMQPILGHARQSVKCARIWLAVSRTPQRQPHSIHLPGRPTWLSSRSFAGPLRRSLPTAAGML
jgi:hypothetical protein